MKTIIILAAMLLCGCSAKPKLKPVAVAPYVTNIYTFTNEGENQFTVGTNDQYKLGSFSESVSNISRYISDLEKQLVASRPNSNGIFHLEFSNDLKLTNLTLTNFGQYATGLELVRSSVTNDYLPILHIKMPCGHTYVLRWGDCAPTNDVPCTCGKTNHWFLRFSTYETKPWIPQ